MRVFGGEGHADARLPDPHPDPLPAMEKPLPARERGSGDLFAGARRVPPTRASAGRSSGRLDALRTVGLGYLALDRPSPTLSRGEAQRVRLAVALTSRLEDMLHILDEPTVGQHPADVARLLPAFRQLAGPVVYVEHDRLAAAQADHAIDLGPGAGAQGGAWSSPARRPSCGPRTPPTGRYFSLRQRVAAPAARPPATRFLTVRGASCATCATSTCRSRSAG